MKTLYFDTSYLFRLYASEPGHEAVRELLHEAETVVSAWHARAEFASILLRKRWEKTFDKVVAKGVALQFQEDRDQGILMLLDLTEPVVAKLEEVFYFAPETTNLRAADALHLACAAEHGFREVYSHDKRFLEAAPLFGLRGVDVID